MVAAVGLVCQAVSADLINASFELEDQGGSYVTNVAPTGWSLDSLGAGVVGYGTHSLIPSQDGDQIAWVQNKLLWQNTGVVMKVPRIP